MLDDPCLVGALGYLEPIIDRGSSSTPYDDIYHVVEESVHLLRDLRLDLPAASRDTTAPVAFEGCTLHTCFHHKHHNSEN